MKTTLVLSTLLAFASAAPAMAQESAPEPVVGQEYLQELESGWSMICEKTIASEDPCFAMERKLQDESGVDMMRVEFTRYSTEGIAAILVINAPQFTLLPRGITMSIDGGSAARVPFFFCDTQACSSRVELRPGDLAAFKRGSSAVLGVVPVAAPDQVVSATLSLAGFTAAFDALTPLDAQ